MGDAFRGATWISLHNGGGVGWGEVVNGGFGLVLDGSADAARRVDAMLHWDVIMELLEEQAKTGAEFAIKEAMKRETRLKVTLAEHADESLVAEALAKT